VDLLLRRPRDRPRHLARVRARGAPEQLARGATGPFACESADGKDLLFQPKDADSPLMAMALLPGEVRQLVACVRNSVFGTGPQGIYYVRRARGLMLDKVSEERGDDAEKDERTGQKRQNPIERRGV
jgi:hypothetical protein